MWRNYYELLFFEFKSHQIIYSNEFLQNKNPISGNNSAKFFFPPIGPNPPEIIKKIMEEVKDMEFHRVPENIINQLEKNCILCLFLTYTIIYL